MPRALLQTSTDETQMHLLLHTQHIPQHQGACAQVSLKKSSLYYYLCEKHEPGHREKEGEVYARSFPAASHLHGSPRHEGNMKGELATITLQQGSWAGGKGKLQHVTV